MEPYHVIIPTQKTRQELTLQIEEMTRTAGIPIEVIVTSQQASASCNRNYGLEHSTSNPVAMVDDDIIGFSENWLKLLLETMEKYPLCVMASARLVRADGGGGFFMMGGIPNNQETGISLAQENKLPTACVVIRKNELRFDKHFIGSGFEDDDYCAQLRVHNPNAVFLVNHEVRVVHKNEMKNQQGVFWAHNKKVFERKWGSHRHPNLSKAIQ